MVYDSVSISLVLNRTNVNNFPNITKLNWRSYDECRSFSVALSHSCTKLKCPVIAYIFQFSEVVKALYLKRFAVSVIRV